MVNGQEEGVDSEDIAAIIARLRCATQFHRFTGSQVHTITGLHIYVNL
jgi:hypothetical protein